MKFYTYFEFNVINWECATMITTESLVFLKIMK